MKLTIEMSLENAAYREPAPYPWEGGLIPEAVASDVEAIGSKIRAGQTHGSIIDVNGNSVGSWKIE